LLLTLLVLVLIQEPAPGQPGPSEAAQAHERFNAGETIIEHVSNNHEHPLIELPRLGGIDFSITKHVFMLWFVAALVFLIVTSTIRRYLRQDQLVPSGFMNGLEAVVEFVRDDIAQPNVGRKWVMTWTPLILTFFFFILSANGIGLIPIFDTLAVLDRLVLHTSTDSFLNRLIHGGTTATANFNVTAALASITFISIIIAGSKAHGFVQHWKNMVPRPAPVDLRHTDSDRGDRYVGAAFRVDYAACGQYDGRPHRDSGDPVFRVSLHRDVWARYRGYWRRHDCLCTACSWNFCARDHRGPGAGLCVHVAFVGVHWNGYSHSSLDTRRQK